MNLVLLIIWPLLVPFALLNAASDPSDRTASQIARALEARYHHARTLKAVFFESFHDGNGGVSAESGTVYFSRPGRMRWEYESPEQKLFLVDGTNAWFYVPADRTASHAKFKESSDWRTPLALLAGKADLSRLCASLEVMPQVNPSGAPQHAGANTILRCIPRRETGDSDNPLREIQFDVDAQDHLAGVRILQTGNWELDFRFGDWQEDVSIPEIKFHFTPPPGVALVEESSLAAGLH